MTKNTKKTLLAITTVGLIAAASATAVFAGDRDGKGWGRHHQPSPEQVQQRIEMMTEKLALTPEQVTQLEALHAERNKNREAMQAFRDSLTEEQQAKFGDMHKDRGSRGDWGKGRGDGDCQGKGGEKGAGKTAPAQAPSN